MFTFCLPNSSSPWKRSFTAVVRCLISFSFPFPLTPVQVQAAFEAEPGDSFGGDLGLDARQHLRLSLKPGGKAHNVPSAATTQTQTTKEIYRFE